MWQSFVDAFAQCLIRCRLGGNVGKQTNLQNRSNSVFGKKASVAREKVSKLVHRVSQTYWSLLVLFSGTVFSIFAETASSPKRWQISTSIVWYLSSTEGGRQERRKKESTLGTMGKGMKKAFSPNPSFPALSIFRLFLFSLGYPARASTAKRVMWWLFWNGCETKNSLQSVHLSELFSVCTFMSFYFHERFRSSC